FFFFFQAEDGIRDGHVTGVQTCALPILTGLLYTIPSIALFAILVPITGFTVTTAEIALVSYTLLILIRNIVVGLRGVAADVRERSEERRVGKEWRGRWGGES